MKNVPIILSAEEAIRKIPSSSTVAFLGAGGGIVEPTLLINTLAKMYRETKEPKNLTFFHPAGLGDRADRGMSPLAQKGLVRRIIGGHWGQSPRLAEMAARNEIEAYNLPMGTMSQMLRATAAGRPGVLSQVGLNTFIDPRQKGGKLNEATKEDLVRLMEIDGKEYLFYPSIPIDVALIRGSTADTDGYISMEEEVMYCDALAMAMAAKNSGGLVIAQVKRICKARTLHPKTVKIPGYLVDILVVDPDQHQLYSVPINRFFSGDYTAEFGEIAFPPLDERKVINRRALLEVTPGDVGNVGVGICDAIGLIAQEEGVDDKFTLTVETGPIGGVSAQGHIFGASVNCRAIIDMTDQFDFYDGGGLDICFVSFAEVDQYGNVNVSRFSNQIMGTGGFVNITQNSKKIVFCGRLTAGGFKATVENGKLRIAQEGKFIKMVSKVEEITFNGQEALKRGQEVLYITERAVFRLKHNGVEICEVAPGMDIERDIFAHMGFKPHVSPELKEMDKRLFLPEPMGIANEWLD